MSSVIVERRSPDRAGATWQVLVVGDTLAACEPVLKPLQAAGMSVAAVAGASDLIRAVHAHAPECIVLPHALAAGPLQGKLEELKQDPMYTRFVILALVEADLLPTMNWQNFPADDYLALPLNHEELLARLRLNLTRSQRHMDANPLTRLPGNHAIMREVQGRLETGIPFIAGYFDIDHFKAFNDKYGFSRGDEVLRMTARLLVTMVQRHGPGFVGHVGGDDFIFLSSSRPEAVCGDIVQAFDGIAGRFYDEEDRLQGGIRVLGRRDVEQVFPLMSCSIAVVDTAFSKVRHLADVAARTAEIKKHLKSVGGSLYLVDRRN